VFGQRKSGRALGSAGPLDLLIEYTERGQENELFSLGVDLQAIWNEWIRGGKIIFLRCESLAANRQRFFASKSLPWGYDEGHPCLSFEKTKWERCAEETYLVLWAQFPPGRWLKGQKELRSTRKPQRWIPSQGECGDFPTAESIPF
jgi:hypothetical protein